MWMIVAGLVGGGIAALLVVEHYALAHLAPVFRAFPPLAYSVGVGTLFLGYGLWAALVDGGGPLAPWQSVAACAIITAIGGAGDILVYWWQPRQGAAQVRALAAALREEGERE